MNPVVVALCNDYDVVVHGLEAMLAPFSERVKVVELNVDTETITPVDVTLYDTFAQPPQGNSASIDRMVTNPSNGRVVIYTWNIQPQLVQMALARGCAGYLDKASSADELAEAIEQIAVGQLVIPHRMPSSWWGGSSAPGPGSSTDCPPGKPRSWRSSPRA